MRICGDLRLERALHETLLYLREHMPVDTLFAEYFDPGLGATRTIARADVPGGTSLDLVTPIPVEAREDREFKATAVLHRAVFLNHPDENRMATTMLRFHGYNETTTSIMTMQLLGEGDLFGGLMAVVEQRDAFTDADADLFTLLAGPFKVAMVNALRHRDLLRLKDRLADDNRYLHRELVRLSGDEIVGADFGLKGVMRLVRQVAPTESPVLIAGETGVGKDVVANAVHLGSSRREGPFIAVNCGAIPDSLLDSELFGHENAGLNNGLCTRTTRPGRLRGTRGPQSRAAGFGLYLDSELGCWGGEMKA